MSSKYTVSYAQNREDIILQGFFADYKKKPGFYVDVGAGNPNIDSVTRGFYEAGWRGINLEPINHIHKALQEHRSKDINLNVGISNKPGELNFREYAADGFSTFSKDVQEQYNADTSGLTEKYQDYVVKVVTLAQVFDEQNITTIDFLKIDVEGYEYEVIESNDWNKYRPKVLCIEANHVKRDWRKILKSNRYSLAYFDGLNEYYIDADNPLSFDYVASVIDREPIVRYDVVTLFDELKIKNQILAQDVARQKILLEDFKYHLELAKSKNEELERISGFAKMKLRKGLSKARKKDN